MSSTKKGSKKTTKPIRKAKKSRRTTLFTQDRRLNKTLNRNKPVQNKKKMKKSLTSRDLQDIQ